MASDFADADQPGEGDSPDDDLALEEALVELEALREDNERLRHEYARARRHQYRRAAIGLALVGVVAGAGAILFPDTRDVLVAIAAIGTIAAILTAYLSPERFVAAEVGELIYGQLRDTLDALVGILDLSDRRVYVPVPGHPEPTVRLFVPERASDPLPEPEILEDVIIVPDGAAGRGLAVHPTGEALLAAMLDQRGGPMPRPQDRTDLAAEGLVETYEIADGIDPALELAEGRARFAIHNSVYGKVERIDHPIASTLACALASALRTPVDLTVAGGDDRTDWIVACEWDPDEAAVTSSGPEESR